MFFDKYILKSLTYAYSNFKRIFTGGVLYLLASFGVVFGLWDVILSAMVIPNSTNMDVLQISSITISRGLSTFIMLLNSFSSMVLGIILIMLGVSIFCILSGYTCNIIGNTIKGNDDLPRWKNCKIMFCKGTAFLMGILLLSIIFDMPNVVLRMLANVMYPQYFGGTFLQMPFMIKILSMALTVLSFIINFLEWIYVPLAAINFVKKDDFFGFFQMREVFSKLSLEYVGIVIMVFLISTLFWILCFAFLALTSIIVILYFNFIAGLTVAVVLGCFTVPFLAFYLRVFRYRAYSLYYKNIMESKQ